MEDITNINRQAILEKRQQILYKIQNSHAL